jgi:hypothetical protein
MYVKTIRVSITYSLNFVSLLIRWGASQKKKNQKIVCNKSFRLAH